MLPFSLTPVTAWLQVKANGLIVFVPKYGIEGPVYLTGKEAADKKQSDKLYVLDEDTQVG